MKIIKLLILTVLLCSISASAEIKGGGYVEFSTGAALQESYSTGLVGISGAGGIKINSNVFIGMGTGIELGIGYHSPNIIIPIFATTKFKLIPKSEIAPYIEIKGGVAYPTNRDEILGHYNDKYYYESPIMGYVAPSIGITFNKFNLGIGYTGFFTDKKFHYLVGKFGFNF